jgi:hypothetical protein
MHGRHTYLSRNQLLGALLIAASPVAFTALLGRGIRSA